MESPSKGKGKETRMNDDDDGWVWKVDNGTYTSVGKTFGWFTSWSELIACLSSVIAPNDE